MQDESVDRRSFLKVMGAVGMSSTLGLHPASGHVVEQVAGASPDSAAKPKYSIKFGVIGLDHYHIMGMTAAIIRGGGELVSFYSNLPKAIADFQKLYPNAKLAKSEEEILDDPSLKLIAAAPIPPTGCAPTIAMRGSSIAALRC